MIHIAVVEDEQVHAQALRDDLRRFAHEHDTAFDVTVFSGALSFLESYSVVFDVVFMDIRMPSMNGMDAARRLRDIDPNVCLIFTTSLTQYAVQGYEVDAAAYIVKPFTYADFALKFTRVFNRLERRISSSIMVPIENGTAVLSAPEIAYCEVQGHTTTFYTERGVFRKVATLRSVEEQLAGGDFFKCNHCYLVNLAYIREIRGSDAEVLCAGVGHCLQISRNKRRAFYDAWQSYLKNGGRKR